MLQGQEELDPALEEQAGFTLETLQREPAPVVYNPNIPIETFDFIVTDECHRSIYNLWRQVLEYFDASIIGLTATPSKQTIGFFYQNLVMEYGFDQAVAVGDRLIETIFHPEIFVRKSDSLLCPRCGDANCMQNQI